MTPGELVGRALAGGASVAVTGATGWLGAAALELVAAATVGAPDRLRAYASRARDVRVAGVTVPVRPLGQLRTDPAPDVLVHLAYLTRDRVAELGVDAYVAANAAITTTVVDAVLTHRPRAVVMASSGAVRRADGSLEHDLRANPYGALKRLDELTFAGACQAVGATLVVPRVYSVAGPYITKPDLYAIGSMIAMARSGGPVEVRARGPVVRAYCGVDEVVALSLWAALTGRAGTLDTGGTVVEVGELAGLVAEHYRLAPDAVQRHLDPAAPADRYVPDARRWDVLCGEAGLERRALPDLVAATAAWLDGPRS